ncbi:MAG: EscU/YscU/HrcU family type III secretion system export apparatus switch protein [Sorangiineae bacterium]|nr:EscU/YscU/HrcU family type III secretion system export apparatus switch protein [Polyangiaceae bacterium]MEB2324287.1 EscU/YscU/HrcU family type III secretion system export apparatus switch protein [Sorangiineae bacterium]
MSDKTEEPTPQRLRRAREEGDVPVSGALMQAVSFLVALALAPAAVASLVGRSSELIRAAIAHPHEPLSSVAIAREVVSLLAPLLLAAGAAAAALGFVQSGGVISTKKLAPDLARLNPVSGLKNLWSKQRAVGIVRALAAALVVGWLAGRLLIEQAGSLAAATGSAEAIPVVAGVLTRRLMWLAALVGLALGLVDLLLVRRAWFEKNRMTRDEVKREHRESEGDPAIKAARHRAHQEMLASATISSVRDATVVVVNPTHLATALRYAEGGDDEADGAGDVAPRVVAKGEGELAQRIIEAARAYGVPVVRDVPVARALSELEIGDEIPEALYEAVAEILRGVWEEAEAAGDVARDSS